MTVELRDYQRDLVERIRAAFARHRRVIAVSPTGSGKTVSFAHISANAIVKGKRAYIVAHREEIVEQISAALDRSGVRHGRIQPGHRQTDDLCQVAMVQTLARRLDRVPAPDLITIDEAHHAVAGTWGRVAAAYPRARILGVTATPQRLDGRGLGDAFDVMVLGPTPRELIERGFLARYQYLAPPTEADTGGIKSRMGDYSIEELAALMDKKTLTGSAIGHYRQHLDGRPAIAFCVTVRHAENVAAEFREAGYRAASVDGAMDKTERRRRIAAIGNGELQILTSCELISEGVDVPVVAGAILLRPTQSLGLHLQQVGRCLRPKPDGSAAIILDHAGNVHRHGLPDKIHNWSLESRKKKPAADPVRTCEVCFRVFAVAPGWRAEADCGEGERPVGCALNAPEPKETALPEQVEGTLVPVAAPPAGPEWAGGIDVATAKGRDWYRLMELADTLDKLKQIAKARGYHWRWAVRRMEERAEAARQKEAAAQEVPFVAEVVPWVDPLTNAERAILVSCLGKEGIFMVGSKLFDAVSRLEKLRLVVNLGAQDECRPTVYRYICTMSGAAAIGKLQKMSERFARESEEALMELSARFPPQHSNIIDPLDEIISA